ncbi:hypothetical protein TNCV_3886051 [Trichonephila clavipes]|nr:hypothetical protein TNCV_3886051 [Trichonephila clavipes]
MPDRKTGIRCPVSPNTLRVHTDSMSKLWRWRSVVSLSIVKEVQPASQALATFIPSLQEFHRTKSYCHLYGAQG